jgi:hypothetical protein
MNEETYTTPEGAVMYVLWCCYAPPLSVSPEFAARVEKALDVAVGRGFKRRAELIACTQKCDETDLNPYLDSLHELFLALPPVEFLQAMQGELP